MPTIEHLNMGWLHAPPNPAACCHGLLIREGERAVLVDAGIGLADVADPQGRVPAEMIRVGGFQFHEELTARRQIEESGLPPEIVADVVVTHCDPDHVGGLADFPTATVHVSAEEIAAVESGHFRYSPVQFDHGVRWKTYATNDCEFLGLPARRVEHSLSCDVKLVPLFGHTLGHCGVAVETDDGALLHVGDAYYLRAELDDPEHPVDALAEMAAVDDTLRRETRDRIRKLVAEHGDRFEVTGYHDTSELPGSARRPASAA